MDKPIPFFYYDILSRLVPGAVTLAIVLLMVRERLPQSWWTFFAGQQAWKAVIVPLMIGGLCYVIGVLYEAIDYSPVMGWIVQRGDDKAFDGAWRTLSQYLDRSNQLLSGKSSEQKRRYKFQLWDSLVFIGGSEPGMSSVFAHCHRFQAEHKMFLHLIYPALLFAGYSALRGMPLRACVIFLVIIPMLFYFSHCRNERRWLQALSFCKQLKLIERCAGDYPASETQLKPSDEGIPEETILPSLQI